MSLMDYVVGIVYDKDEIVQLPEQYAELRSARHLDINDALKTWSDLVAELGMIRNFSTRNERTQSFMSDRVAPFLAQADLVVQELNHTQSRLMDAWRSLVLYFGCESSIPPDQPPDTTPQYVFGVFDQFLTGMSASIEQEKRRRSRPVETPVKRRSLGKRQPDGPSVRDQLLNEIRRAGASESPICSECHQPLDQCECAF
jgi:hypothetical protein